MNIRDILGSLPAVDRDALMAAFESGEAYYVEYEPGRFIGVNTDEVTHLDADQTAGSFRAGEINRGSDATTAQAD
jgi:hypothetical protein